MKSGCPICVVVWRHATGGGTIDLFALKLSSAFSRWSVKKNGKDDDKHEHWSDETVIMNISTGSVSYARGLGPLHVFAHDQLDFAVVDASGMWWYRRRPKRRRPLTRVRARD